MLGHLSLGVRELARARRFYDAILSPLGVVCVWHDPVAAGYGVEGGTDKLALFERPQTHAAGDGFHLAFHAPSREAVDAFHAAAMRTGGEDLGGPGARPQYGETYYAAFVRDPDGHKLEAVHQ